MLEKGLKRQPQHADLQMAAELAKLFCVSEARGKGPRVICISRQISNAIKTNVDLLRGEKFATLATAVTMDLEGGKTKCIRQAFVDREGFIVSVDSTSCDVALLQRLRDGEICQVYIFAIVVTKLEEGSSNDGKSRLGNQEFFYREPKVSEDQLGEIPINPLTAYQIDVLDLTMTQLSQYSVPNSQMNIKLGV
tara:strand:- start:49 stop:627 length:579 start_codon:yes stop_codon:yes gene_type:complete